MVSPLSSRILNIQVKANLKSRDTGPVPSNPNTAYPDRRRMKRSSGYSADRESPSETFGANATTVDDKKQRAEEVEAQVRRRKCEEMNFRAANVYHDLKYGGEKYLSDLTSRPQIFSPEDIDMSRVTYTIVSKGDTYRNEPSSLSSALINSIDVSTYFDLLNTTKPFYKLQSSSGKRASTCLSCSSENQSNISSVTTPSCSRSPSVSDDTDSYDASSMAIPGRLDDSFHRQKDFRGDSGPSLVYLTSLSNDQCSSIDEAINHNHSTARVVMLSKHPFTIVYANAAFSDLTGLSSDKVIGKPFDNLLVSDTMIDLLTGEGARNRGCIMLDSSGGFPDDGIGGVDYMECNYCISLVRSLGASANNCSTISHIVLELTKGPDDADVKDLFGDDIFADMAPITYADDGEMAEPAPLSLIG